MWRGGACRPVSWRLEIGWFREESWRIRHFHLLLISVMVLGVRDDGLGVVGSVYPRTWRGSLGAWPFAGRLFHGVG